MVEVSVLLVCIGMAGGIGCFCMSIHAGYSIRKGGSFV